MRVSVCVLTFRRPFGLRTLLEGLEALEFRRSPEPDLEVVVVDNDPEGTAEEVCAAAAAGLRWPLRCVREARRGISHARNRAVASARPGTELVAFIDDDMVPSPAWLDELLHAREAYGADVVLGPTLRRFEGEVPAWVRRGGFFGDRRMPTGTAVEHGGIGNSLIDARLLRESAAPFDERLALTGGEDTHFFLRAARAGKRLVWADEAVAYERVPASRATAGWILRRGYRVANTWSWCERELSLTPRVAALRVGKGLARIGMGLAMLPVGALLGRHVLVRGLYQVAFGAGNLAGLLGHHLREYRTTQGR